MADSPDWKACAYRHLLAHVMKQGGRHSYYCHPSDTVRMGGVSNPHPLTVSLTDCLLRWANCWALDMADWPARPPTAEEQKKHWEFSMREADKECRKLKEEFGRKNDPLNPLNELL